MFNWTLGFKMYGTVVIKFNGLIEYSGALTRSHPILYFLSEKI